MWNGSRRMVDEPFFLAEWDAIPSVRPESDPALRRLRLGRVDAVAGLDVVEPPALAEVAQPPADGTTHPAIAMKWATAAAITSVWKTSWKPNVRGHRLGFWIA